MRNPMIWFTPAGYQALSPKLEELKKKREQILPRLQRAREQGDLSENGAYKAARFELGDTDRQIRYLENQIKHGRIATPRSDGKAGIGNKITLEKIDKSKVTYILVGTFEADPLMGKISTESPVGAEMFGKGVGAYIRGMKIVEIN